MKSPETGEPPVALAQQIARAVQLLASQPLEAKARARDILKAAPKHAHARLILGSALRRLGEGVAARAVLMELARDQPSFPAAHYELGLTLSHLGQGERASGAFRKAAALRPTMVEAWSALGDRQLADAAAALNHNRTAGVAKTLEARLKARPDDVEAIRMFAEVELRLGRYAQAEARLLHALKLSPSFPGLRQALAVVLIQRQKGAEALVHVERLLKAEPNNPHFQNLKAVSLGLMGEEKRSIRVYQAVLAARPDLAKVWLSYGHALKTAGRLDEGIAAYRCAIALSPRLGQAYWSLANLKLVRFDDADVDAMRDALHDPRADDDDRIHLHYALGKALEDAAAYKEAFEQYSEGARLRRRNIPYDARAVTAQTARMAAFFTPAVFDRHRGQGCEAEDPIFVVGLPRSGSTLVEQILSSHSSVEGTRELVEIAAIVRGLDVPGLQTTEGVYPETLDSLDSAAMSALGQRFIDAAANHRKSGRPFFIDKTPSNFMHIGLIRLILPNAKIIDVRRHPMATCVSGFKQHFAGGHDFSYDLSDLGRYYKDYVRLMDHFGSVLPGCLYFLNYEALIDDTEAEVRRLLDYCGLPFESACLRFYENARAVRTPSSEQVRRPISRDGADQWRHFEPWLGPLKEALGAVFQVLPADMK